MPPPVNIAPFRDYLGMMVIQVVTMLIVYFFSRLYDVKRSMPRLDEFYRIFAATSIGTIVTIAFTTFLFKNSSAGAGLSPGDGHLCLAADRRAGDGRSLRC